MAKTLFERIWERHLVAEPEGEPAIVFVDLHLIHEVTSPQAFDGLRLAARRVRRPDLSLATMDHNVPTEEGPVTDPLAKAQLDALRRNCDEFGVPLFATGSGREGIVHVIGPELGLTQPGMTIVCGDSHTATHGAFGALAFGVGTSEVEHVLATQCLPQKRPLTMRVRFDGELPPSVTAKDMILGAIGRLGVAGGIGHVLEYTGPAIRSLSMENRMTICNMSIEAGARAGMIAPDETTFAYLEGRPAAPTGPAWEQALDDWRTLVSDPDATYDSEFEIDVTELAPQVTWGTNPEMVVSVTDRVPDPAAYADPSNRGRRCRTSRSTGSSSAPARTQGSRTYARRRPSSQASRYIRASALSSCRARRRSSGSPRRKGSTGSSSTPGSSGDGRGARCASA